MISDEDGLWSIKKDPSACDLLNITVKSRVFPLSIWDVLIEILVQRMAILTQVLQEGNSDCTLAASLDSVLNALFVTIDGTIK